MERLAKHVADLSSRLGDFGIAAWEWDVAGSGIGWSEQLRAIYGIPPDAELTFELFLSFVHPEDASNVMAVISETLASRRAQHEQYFRILRADGEIRYLLSRAQLECTPDGHPLRLKGVTIDLGGQPRGQPRSAGPASRTPVRPATEFGTLSDVSLAPAAVLYQKALQSIPSHIAVLDWKGRIILVNEAWTGFAKASGSTSSSAIAVGANYLDVCRRSSTSDADAEVAFTGIRAVLDGELPRFEMAYACHGPWEKRWYLMTVVPLLHGGGAVVSHHDITQLRGAERALRVSEARFRATFDNAAVGMAHVAADGRLLGANRRLCEMSGYTDAELRALASLRDVVHREDRDIGTAHLEVMRSGGSDACRMEQRIVRKDGSVVWVITTLGCVRTENGAIDYFVAGVEDVSSQKLVEQRQQTLLQELSHRGKNLLGVIQSIVARSLAGDRSLEEARSVLNRRLQALAHTYDTLTKVAFDGVLLDVVVRDELKSFSRRVQIDGPPIKLTDKATQTVALIAHELATNAAKYGALSVPGGQLHVGWQLVGDPQSRRLRFEWREQGGPPAKPPTRRGFGTILTTQIAGSEFACTPVCNYDEHGFGYMFEAPVSRLGAEVIDTPVRRNLKSPIICSLYDTWSRQRPPNGLPPLAGFDWSRFAATGALTIANVATNGDIHFAQIGHALTERLGRPIEEVADLAGDTARVLLKAYSRCATKGEPTHETMRIDFGDGDPITFERLLVPFSVVGGRTPTHIVGIVVFEGISRPESESASTVATP